MFSRFMRRARSFLSGQNSNTPAAAAPAAVLQRFGTEDVKHVVGGWSWGEVNKYDMKIIPIAQKIMV